MVPEEALTQRADGAFLFRIGADDRVERVDVQTGVRSGGRVEIVGPIYAGERVVRRGHGGLSDGMVVVVRETTGQTLNALEDVTPEDVES
jgi:membrane fusion protein (multidrug efflux system)